MSLIRARRDRRELSGTGAKQPPPLFRLVLLLLFVIGLIWWMGSLGG